MAEAYDEKSGKAGASAGAASGRLYNITAAEGMEEFAGTIRYEADFMWIRIAMGKCFRLILELSMKRWRYG